MEQRSSTTFMVFLLLALFTCTPPAGAAYLTLDLDGSNFLGQRGAGITIDGTQGTTDFGHLEGTITDTGVEMSGEGWASTSTTTDVYADEGLSHSITIEMDENSGLLSQDASLSLEGSISGTASVTVEVTDNNWGWRSYADSTAKPLFVINPGSTKKIGDPVKVHILSIADSYRDGPFDTEVYLAWLDPFRILHNGTVIFSKDGKIDDPTDIADLEFDALIGDTIEIDSAIFANLWGSQVFQNVEFFQGDASISINHEIELSAVPLPSAVWLLASGLAGVLIVRRRRISA